jgi:hypothetical protein
VLIRAGGQRRCFSLILCSFTGRTL